MSDAAPGILWTPMPLELIVEGLQQAAVPACLEMSVEGRTLQVIPGSDGMGTVQRLISGNPQDYLDPRWQPGTPIRLS